MAQFKKLITGNNALPPAAIMAQRLAATMAWQILWDYPRSRTAESWKIYENIRGVMLADEVGCGKTFETLAILSKLLLTKSTRHNFRVLIIANPSIRSKWQWDEDEIYASFCLNKPNCEIGKFINQTTLTTSNKQKLYNFFKKQEVIFSKRNWINTERTKQGIWLSSFQNLPVTKGSGENSRFRQDKRSKPVFPNNFFDLIIVDEAHSLKSGSKDVDESLKLDNSAIRKIYAAINSNPSAKVLLLTATPFQNNKTELKHLLSLLENKLNGGISFTGTISEGIDQLEKEIDDLKTNISKPKLLELKHKFDNDINGLLYNKPKIARPRVLQVNGCKNGLDDYIRDIMVRNTKKQLTIEPVNAILGDKEKLQYLLFRDQVKDIEGESNMFSTKLSQMVSSASSFQGSFKNKNAYQIIERLFSQNLIFQCKLDRLLDLIKSIQVTNGKNVITVFVSWIKTVEELKRQLEKNGFRNKVFTLTGSDKPGERTRKLTIIKSTNARATSKIILLASRVGNEGLDFDDFSNRVVHYDNNYNPAIIDQRNGRVYRGSNIKTVKKKVVDHDIQILQLFLEETYDQRILFIEEEKRKLKNFYLGDASIQKILEKTLQNNDLKNKEAMLKVIESIWLDLTPNKRYIFKKYHNEIG